MFSTIFKQELKYWFNKPAFYIYTSIFVLLAFFLSANFAGLFDSVTATVGSSRIVNSPIGVNNLMDGLTTFIFFLFPSIMGVSIYRDYKSEMHTILYSYPFTKANYLFAKFFSAIVVVSIIVLSIALGMIIGFRFPGTNSEIVGAFNVLTYLQTYLVFILPNILLFGAIVFAVVTYTRNIAAGFIAVIILFLIQGIIASVLSDPEQSSLAAILDPFGSSAVNHYTKYWTPSEQNELQIPLKELIVYNRLLWLAIAVFIFGMVYKFFTFSQNAISFSFKKTKGERIIKSNFSGITKIVLPKVTYNFSFLQNLKTMWKLSNIDFKYIFKSWAFISIVLVGFILLMVTLFNRGEVFGTKTLPVTWQMLIGGRVFIRLAIIICTFLYAGMLVHRANIARIDHLVDTTPVPNWTLLFSKVIAILKMQLVLLSVILISGIVFQIYKGYYNFEVGHYLKELFFLDVLNLLVWTLLAIFIQTLIRNPYLGLFILLVISIGMPFLSLAGIEQSIFKYNEGPGFRFSDMNGYGTLAPYLWYKIYWILCGLILLIVSFLFWVRGIPNSFSERISIAKSRFKGFAVVSFTVFLLLFLVLGYSIYQETGTKSKRTSSKERELQRVNWEKTYKKYESYAQPRIVAVKTDVAIFPKKKTFEASAVFTMINKTDEAIDSIFLNHNSLKSTFEFSKANNLVLEDTINHFDVYHFENKILPGDTLQLSVTVKSNKNSAFRTKSPIVENGTFINNFSMFPTLGYSSAGELTDNKTRKKYDLSKNNLRPHPSDSTALGDTYISKDSDWIDFEATVSTSIDQIAIAPGYLQKEWTENDRRYFHYKMDSKILNFYAFNSAKYEVKKDKWNDVILEIYYHKGHEYNLERMLKGMKASLDYNSKNFSPYQHKQLRIVEFPSGAFAQSFPNTIPFAGDAGFIADVVDEADGGVDYSFAITVHEVAHQWWAHQVIGADVLGATMLSESLSEYVSLKVLEHEHGKEKMRIFLKEALDGYLSQRAFETKRENPLMYNDGQSYIRYQKGSLVFYALSDYIGEEKLNGALKEYVEKVKFQEPPYTTSIELVDYIREVTPDSLQYVIKDMFETITLYKNRIVDVKSTELENGKYQVDIEFEVSKYRNDKKGKRYYGEKVGDTLSYKTDKMKKAILSVPLVDYIDIGVFTVEEIDDKKQEKILYLNKHKITAINNKITIIVDEKPTEVGVDPFNKLIDTQSEDNRRKL
ncbi:MAG: M1 family aminopeptidase [Polaribacter sp.]|uniref:ABC transporter permease/M1 family aminopeptidase n=1 Tax=Polaribacter sp. TaxID=1920175 RepID=UPI002F34F945